MERTREDEIRSRLDDIAGPDPGAAERALLARLLHSFTAKTPARVDHLGELLRGGDQDAVRDHAHGLKGSAANIGATTLAALFAEIEHAAREGVVPDPDSTFVRIRAEQEIVLGSVARVASELDV
ncbi:Hpt domain-containing protein [Actinoplanes sp. TBRC 11911]|uniref:Hpt domain-containing protein n=1 Tax=Actinoplanes sp. TBRC 11911 TaxID=2729386 RepID=UPI00145CD628|nr:Hpt domain-containing protein [Actinoplanes sp. TBRC 11911]NMO56582.1 Hpt domain-containing protein [Actinoplanes sp. TBRC 11911]